MLPRLWIVLLAVLLLAAPAGSAFEETADAQPSIGLVGGCDDAALTQAAAPLPERTPDRVARTVTRDGAPPADPLRDPIFRPPRPPATPTRA